MSRLIIALVFVAFVAFTGGLAVLAAWDVPVAETSVEKTLDNSKFLTRNS